MWPMRSTFNEGVVCDLDGRQDTDTKHHEKKSEQVSDQSWPKTLVFSRLGPTTQNDWSLYSNTDTFSNDFVQRIRWLARHRSVIEKTPERVGTGFGGRNKK